MLIRICKLSPPGYRYKYISDNLLFRIVSLAKKHLPKTVFFDKNILEIKEKLQTLEYLSAFEDTYVKEHGYCVSNYDKNGDYCSTRFTKKIRKGINSTALVFSENKICCYEFIKLSRRFAHRETDEVTTPDKIGFIQIAPTDFRNAQYYSELTLHSIGHIILGPLHCRNKDCNRNTQYNENFCGSCMKKIIKLTQQ